METEQQKFERTREKFRRNIHAQRAKTRRTVFLQPDETPPTNRRAQRGKRNQHNQGADCRRSTARHTTTTPPQRTTSARHFRIAVVPPARPYHRRLGPHDGADEIITLSDDEEIAPPPPPVTVTTPQPADDDDVAPPPPPSKLIPTTPEDQAEEMLAGRGSGTQSPVSPFESEIDDVLDDLCLTADDLNDPMIEEFYRTFLGENDTTVDLRPTTPPSPYAPSSSSSLDWENENFRPPTPPKRRGFVVLETRDSQYPYLGMQCYERVWRAKLLIPRKQTTSALAGPTLSPTPPPTKEIFDWGHSTPPRRSDAVPTTPGRGWLQQSPNKNDLQKSATPTTTTIAESLTFDQLPAEVQREILQKAGAKTGRKRFTHQILGDWYRVIGRREGDIELRLIRKAP